VTGLQAALDGKQSAGSYATLVNNLVPSANLPSFVDDVVDVGGTLPSTGDVGKIYVVSTGANTNKIYRWSGSTFIEISPSPGSTDAVAEGSVNLYHTTLRAAAAAPVQSVAGRTGTVTLAQLGSSGTASETTFLRGDGAWAAAGSTNAGDLTSGTLASARLPLATTTAAGAVIVGSGLAITNGVLSRSSSYDPAAAPGPPTGIYYSNLQVSWTASPGGVATSYELQYTSNEGATYTTAASGITSTSAGFPSGFKFRVRGFNSENLPGEWGYQEGLLPPSGGGGGGSGGDVDGGVYAAAAAPSGNDPLWSSVRLLMPLNTNTNDFRTGTGATVTAFGNAAIATSSPKFGAGSLLLDGNGDYLQIVDTLNEIVSGTGDFTLEMWVRPAALLIEGQYLFDTRASQIAGYGVYLTSSSTIVYSESALITGSALTAGQWQHVAVCRASGTLRLFVNGSVAGSPVANTTNFASNRIFLGRSFADLSPYWFDGSIDDVRYTSAARYTATFTPPTSANPTS
jgi:hypothetical protein